MSFYRVTEENGVARVEEAPNGILYGVAYAFVIFGSAWPCFVGTVARPMPNNSIEPTATSTLRALVAAPHVER